RCLSDWSSDVCSSDLGGKVSTKVREIGARPAAALPENAAILRYIRAVDAHLGIRAHLDISSTDANVPLAMGIPALAIGAGGVGRSEERRVGKEWRCRL